MQALWSLFYYNGLPNCTAGGNKACKNHPFFFSWAHALITNMYFPPKNFVLENLGKRFHGSWQAWKWCQENNRLWPILMRQRNAATIAPKARERAVLKLSLDVCYPLPHPSCPYIQMSVAVSTPNCGLERENENWVIIPVSGWDSFSPEAKGVLLVLFPGPTNYAHH